MGYRIGEWLLRMPAPAIDAAAQADVAAMIALVECEMRRMLSGSSEGDASSAASSSSSTPPPTLPVPVPPPLQPAQMVPAQAVAPFLLDASASLGANLGRHVAMRMRRSLQPEEQSELDGALETGLSVLSAETAEARRQLLAATAIVALSNAGAAQLWACALEACGDVEVESVAALAAEITTQCGTISAALLSAALGV